MSLATVIIALMLLVVLVWGIVALLSNPIGQAVVILVVLFGFVAAMERLGLIDNDN